MMIEYTPEYTLVNLFRDTFVNLFRDTNLILFSIYSQFFWDVHLFWDIELKK